MSGKHDYIVLSSAYSPEHLINHGKDNGVYWEEHKHPGVNWMRFSHALIQHLDEGKNFHLDEANPEHLKLMLNHYIALRDLHKQTMVPHLRATMAKLYADRGDGNIRPMDLLQDAHQHLAANGGHIWAEKIHTLTSLNRHIDKLHSRLNEIGRLNS